MLILILEAKRRWGMHSTPIPMGLGVWLDFTTRP